MNHDLESGLFLINEAFYLHIQERVGNFEYTLYDKETLCQIHHDQISDSLVWEQPVNGVLAAARYAVFEDYGINFISIDDVPSDMLDDLRKAQFNPPLDEYPMPDPLLFMTDIACMGYLKKDLLPVSDDKAAGFLQQGFTLHEVDAFGKVKNPSEQSTPGKPLLNALYAISRQEWETSPTFHVAVADRMNHQAERELAFRCHNGDCFAIYQLNHHDPDMRYLRYESMEYLESQGLCPVKDNYELVYTSRLPDGMGLNALWHKFNTDHPPDYRHPSLSVSDVIAVKKSGAVRCFYIDEGSYVPLDNFFQNPSRQTQLFRPSRKPSIRAQLAVKPVPGSQPVTKPKDREVR